MRNCAALRQLSRRVVHPRDRNVRHPQ